jgi:predicted HTH transcriptional regulator
MSLLGKALETINESDLQGLVDNRTIENKYLEYKRELPGERDSDKKEFLADISSFANTSGGDLIFGISTVRGTPREFCGLQVANVDQEISRLENIMRTGLAPRIQTHIRPVGKSESRIAIIVRVKKSWAAPHMITFKND